MLSPMKSAKRNCSDFHMLSHCNIDKVNLCSCLSERNWKWKKKLVLCFEPRKAGNLNCAEARNKRIMKRRDSEGLLWVIFRWRWTKIFLIPTTPPKRTAWLVVLPDFSSKNKFFYSNLARNSDKNETNRTVFWNKLMFCG